MVFDPTFNYGDTDFSIDRNRIFWQFSELIKLLVILSDNAEIQIDFMDSDSIVTDEMALDFHSLFSLNYPFYLEEGLLTSEQLSKLLELNAFFDEKSDNGLSDFWDDSQLDTNPEWEIIRQQAKIILQLFQMDDLVVEFIKEYRYETSAKDKQILIKAQRTRLVKKFAN